MVPTLLVAVCTAAPMMKMQELSMIPPRRPKKSAMKPPASAPPKVPIESSDVMRDLLVEEMQLHEIAPRNQHSIFSAKNAEQRENRESSASPQVDVRRQKRWVVEERY